MSRTPRTVLLFIETGGPGGAERVVVSLAYGLAAAGVKVATTSLRQGWMTEQLTSPAAVAAGISYHPLSSTRSLDIGLPLRLAQLTRKVRADVLHSHLLDSNFYASLAARLARVPHLGTEHGDIHHIHKRRFLGAKLKLMDLLGTQFSAVSEYTAQALVDAGIGRANISCIGNPIDCSLTTDNQSKAERTAVRQELGLTTSEADWLWLHVANFRPVKDQATLIKGFATASRRSTQPQVLALIGDGALRAELEALAQTEGVTDRVKFLGFRDDVPRLLAAADGFILSSVSEALPMAILEAALAGITVVSSAVGGVPEIIIPGKTGFLFAPGSPTDLAEAITRVVSDKAASRQIADQCRDLVRSRFSTETVVEQFLSRYDQLR